MPSPFPGMDPYLEGEMWQEFHETLAGAIRGQLVRLLPRTYVALLAKRYVEEVPLLSVEVRDVAQRRLVTAIEVLSPVNKEGDGAREYDERRTTLLETRTHLLEIDLLRRGTRVRLLGEPPRADYYVYLSRMERR